MLNFDFLEKVLEIVTSPNFAHDFSEKFEISLSFLIKPFLYMTKKSRQKIKYVENKKSF